MHGAWLEFEHVTYRLVLGLMTGLLVSVELTSVSDQNLKRPRGRREREKKVKRRRRKEEDVIKREELYSAPWVDQKLLLSRTRQEKHHGRPRNSEEVEGWPHKKNRMSTRTKHVGMMDSARQFAHTWPRAM